MTPKRQLVRKCGRVADPELLHALEGAMNLLFELGLECSPVYEELEKAYSRAKQRHEKRTKDCRRPSSGII